MKATAASLAKIRPGCPSLFLAFPHDKLLLSQSEREGPVRGQKSRNWRVQGSRSQEAGVGVQLDNRFSDGPWPGGHFFLSFGFFLCKTD